MPFFLAHPAVSCMLSRQLSQNTGGIQEKAHTHTHTDANSQIHTPTSTHTHTLGVGMTILVFYLRSTFRLWGEPVGPQREQLSQKTDVWAPRRNSDMTCDHLVTWNRDTQRDSCHQTLEPEHQPPAESVHGILLDVQMRFVCDHTRHTLRARSNKIETGDRQRHASPNKSRSVSLSSRKCDIQRSMLIHTVLCSFLLWHGSLMS